METKTIHRTACDTAHNAGVGAWQTLRAGAPVVLTAADNLPAGNAIKWWARPPAPGAWNNPALEAAAESVGVGLRADDVKSARTAFLHVAQVRPDGQRDTLQTLAVPMEERPLGWQLRGLSYTASGYGRRIPTRYVVKFNGRWRRVYGCVYSNAGTCYIGKFRPRTEPGQHITVDIS